MTSSPRASTIVYLHGYATGPRSRKARIFESACEANGVIFACPDLNVPSFAELSFAAMTEVVVNLLDERVGTFAVASSMGASVLVNSLVRWREANPGERLPLTAMALFAPTADFRSSILRLIGPEQGDRWRREGWKAFPHHAAMKDIDVSYDLLEGYARPTDEDLAAIDVPTVIVHGANDDVISQGDAEALHHALPDSTLVEESEADHRLSQLGSQAWDRAASFFSDVSGVTLGRAQGPSLDFGICSSRDLRLMPDVAAEATEVLVSAYGQHSHPREVLSGRMTSEPGFLAWARDGSRLVGCSHVRADGKWGACGTLPEYRGYGTGFRLARLGQRHMPEQLVEVGRDSAHALRLVLGCGFRPVYEESTARSILRSSVRQEIDVVDVDELGVVYRREREVGGDTGPLRLCLFGFHDALA